MKKNPYVNPIHWYDGFSVVVILFILAVVLWGMSFHEVETYTFHATITNMELVREQHRIYWVDGMISSYDVVKPSVYAQYMEGDLIEVTGVIRSDCFGNETESFEIRD
jgi:hypothetical protein